MMKVAEKLAVVCCLFRVALCSTDFSINLPESVEAVSGLCVLIPCTFTIEQKYDEGLKRNPKGIWLKDGTKLHNTVFDSSTPENNKIQGKITGDLLMKNCTTIFNSVREADSGKYYFRIGNLPYTYVDGLSMTVKGSPPNPTLSVYVDQKEVQDQWVLEGRSVSVFCSAFSPCVSRPPTLTWSPLSQTSSQEQIQNSSFISSHLNFIATHLDHRVSFTCTATYKLEDKTTKTVQKSFLLSVLYPPKNTSVSVSPPGPVLLGSSVSLNCSSEANPSVNYTWFRENGEQIGTEHTLTITDIDVTHSGFFYCRAQNQHGAQNSSVQLDVQYPPKKMSVSVSPPGPVLLGSSVSLNCRSEANPAVNYTWFRENGEQIGTEHTLNINKTDVTHSGFFYCRAQNQYGAQNISVQLDVQYLPKNTSVSVNPPGPVLLGSSVSLNCSSDANPAVNYTWFRENGEQIGTGHTLNINKTDETHSGFFYCRAQNQHGAQNSSAQLDIQYSPKNTSVSVSPPGPVLLGSSVSLNCSSDANPAVNYTWFRQNGEQIGTEHTLTINEIDETHSGFFYCRAQNQHGAQNSYVQLEIQYDLSLSSHCNSSSEGGITCVCEVHGQPAPKLEWRLSGKSVTPSEDTSIKNETVGRTGLRSFLSIRQSLSETPRLQCFGTSKLGNTTQLLSFVSSGHCATTGHFPMLVGAAAGAISVMVGFVIYLCTRRMHCKPLRSGQQDTTGLVLNDKAVCQEEEEEESLYANRTILSSTQVPIQNNPDILHYSTIYMPNDKEGSGAIRGLSSLTPDYATVQHICRDKAGRENTKAATEDQQTKEETYGNIIRQKSSKSNMAAELSETKPIDPEQVQHTDEAQGLYAQVKHKSV